jgi:hypothetical protein
MLAEACRARGLFVCPPPPSALHTHTSSSRAPLPFRCSDTHVPFFPPLALPCARLPPSLPRIRPVPMGVRVGVGVGAHVCLCARYHPQAASGPP